MSSDSNFGEGQRRNFTDASVNFLQELRNNATG